MRGAHIWPACCGHSVRRLHFLRHNAKSVLQDRQVLCVRNDEWPAASLRYLCVAILIFDKELRVLTTIHFTIKTMVHRKRHVRLLKGKGM